MVGSLVRRARQERGLSQTDLARLSGIDQPNISAIENDRRAPTAATLTQLLEACGFRLGAVAGPLVLHASPTSGDRDLVATPAPAPVTEDVRVRMVVAVLDASEAIVRGRA